MKLFIFTFKILLTLLFFTAVAIAQVQINPATQILWPACSPGQVYQPNGNLCGSGGGGSMTWPGVAGVACYSGSSSWCTSYSSSNLLPANYIPTLNQNTTGTAANITATSNTTLTTLSALSLPYTQLSGTVPTWNQNTTGTAANITATSNTTLTTLSALSLPISQVTGTINATQVNGAAVPASKTIVGTNGSGQIVDASSATLGNNTTGTAANVTATSNATLVTLSALSLPYTQITSVPQASASVYGVVECGSGTTCASGVISVSGGTGTVTDGSGVTTANIIPVSTTTAHVLGYTPNSTFNLLAPTITANDTVATLGLAQTFTGANSFTSSILPTTSGTPSLGSTTKWWNSVYLGTGTSYYVNLTPATPTASYTLTIPALTANDTIATLAGAQTFTGTKTFPSPTFTGTVTSAAISPSGLIQSTANNGAIRLAGAVNAASSYQVQIQASPYAGGTSTTNFPVVAFNPSGTAVTTWNATASGGTFMGFAPATGFAGNLIDGHAPNGGASIFSVNYLGFVSATGHGNISSLTVAAGAALGSSPTIACATNTTCGWNGGVVNILVGTSPTTGVAFTITDAITHPKYPACTYEIFPSNSSYVKNGPQLALANEIYDTNASFTVQTYNLSSALTTATYYVVNYTCIGQ